MVFNKCTRQGGTQSRRKQRAGLELGTRVLSCNVDSGPARCAGSPLAEHLQAREWLQE